MAELPARQIAWQIIAANPDPQDREREAQGYPGPVVTHVRAWNEHEDLKMNVLRRTFQKLAKLRRNAPTPAERRAAARDYDTLRYQCQGWILDRLREMPKC